MQIARAATVPGPVVAVHVVVAFQLSVPISEVGRGGRVNPDGGHGARAVPHQAADELEDTPGKLGI